MEAGAVGYVLKDASKEDLAAAIRAAKAGQTTMAPEAAEDLLSGSHDSITDLTDREREVLLLLAQGMTNKQIGKQLASQSLYRPPSCQPAHQEVGRRQPGSRCGDRHAARLDLLSNDGSRRAAFSTNVLWRLVHL